MAILTGACLCGAIAFELDRPPLGARYCHCTRCQRRTGTSSSANAAIDPASLTVTRGREHLGGFQPPDGARKSFCGLCGGALFSGQGDEISAVRLGAFDGDPGVRPDRRQYVADAAAWETIPDDGLARYDGPAPPVRAQLRPATPGSASTG